jgi:Ran GTPase-activating protein (RanGAP) involved in mRNA processing and transport
MRRFQYLLPLIALTTGKVQSFVVVPLSFTGRRQHNQIVLSDLPEDDLERAKVPIRKKRSRFFDEAEEMDDEYYSVASELEDEDYEDWDEDDEDWDDEDDDEYGLFSNVIIANPLLDNMDPDGAAERFPELAADPRFWFDMVLFICVLNFLSSCAARDPLPNISWY